ncbi:Maleylacetate reductase [Sphingomonas sp. Root710]|uniref:maleylacetate reductase n=1 Tax=Sphingomonas sp. Root710 TaxID=1736594 RepID=UPI0006F94609|nr:maleylacetate reductase [Sphingomonas sp. Root710]KRB81416.1 Maleylacetate reductase [Sphingomonas sp. Root710]
MAEPFVYTANPGRVIFGEGTIARLPEEVERLGLARVLLLATPQQEADAERLADRLGDHSAGVFAGAVMHTPVEVTERAMAIVAERGVDGVVAIGGGSTIGLGKAIAYRTDLPQIVIPTTYAGSEMTPILGETSDGAKTTRSDAKILPEVVIYDVDLTMTLPAALSGTSGINAIAHAIEALYARDRNPIISLMAVEGIGALVRALPVIAADPADKAARSDALYGAWLCGSCLGAVGMALHHKLCHVLGGSFDLPHAETHTIVLPHALAYNAPAIPEVMTRLLPVLGRDPARALYDLAGAVGAKRGLRHLGMDEMAIDEAVSRAMANPYWNPRPLDAGPLRALIARAWAGDPPAA